MKITTFYTEAGRHVALYRTAEPWDKYGIYGYCVASLDVPENHLIYYPGVVEAFANVQVKRDIASPLPDYADELDSFCDVYGTRHFLYSHRDEEGRAYYLVRHLRQKRPITAGHYSILAAYQHLTLSDETKKRLSDKYGGKLL